MLIVKIDFLRIFGSSIRDFFIYISVVHINNSF
jgi:hypothetical protein